MKNNYQLPKIHHVNPDMQKLFENYEIAVSKKWKNVGIDRDLPPLHYLKNGNYVIWSDGCTCNQSAWNEQQIIEGSGWSDPFEIQEKDKENCLYYADQLWDRHKNEDFKKNPKRRSLKGNYVGFHSWWSNAYGHVIHDSLPLLAYLKASVDNSFKFLILNQSNIKNILKAFDKDFYNRVEWIELGEVISVEGDLIVPTPDHCPCIMANNLMSYLLDWISISSPKPIERNNIIFYTRHNVADLRVLNLENEKDIIASLKKFLIDNKINGNLIIFSSKDENGNTLSVEEQISIFRSANTIIGPHGTGLSNITWCDFDNNTPIKLLEFCAGPLGYSAHVQQPFAGFQTLLKGLPMQHHMVLYEPHSTPTETFIDLKDFNAALTKIFLNE